MSSRYGGSRLPECPRRALSPKRKPLFCVSRRGGFLANLCACAGTQRSRGGHTVPLLQRGLVRPATIVDHVEPHRGNWNKFLTGKLQSLCEHCHNADKRMAEQGKPRATIGEDGWPT